MPRQDAVLRLREMLLARRVDLSLKLAVELADLRDFRAAESAADSADVAFETSSYEIASQLAELDADELSQTERALARLNQRTYGICEGCQARIPAARLNALPAVGAIASFEKEVRFPGAVR
jgi:RNA polymerase-binding transcription factor DksA